MNQPKPTQPRKRIFLNAENILRFFITEDETLNNLLIYQGSGPDIVSTDTQIYQALGSIEDKDEFNRTKLVKLF